MKVTLQKENLVESTANSNDRFTRRQLIAVFLAFAILIFLAFQMFLPERYKNDSYAHMETSASQIAATHLGGFRFIPALNMLLYAAVNTTDVAAQMVNNIFLLLSLSFSATVLFIALVKKVKELSISKIALLVIGVSLLYVNTFVGALALFPETGMFMGLGYLLVTIAAVFTSKKTSVINYLTSFILLFLALGTYQALLGFYSFIAFSLLVAAHGLSFSRESLRRVIVIVSILVLASVANILVGKVLCSLFRITQNSRTASLSMQLMFSNILSIFRQQSRLWNGLLHTMPKLLGIIVCAVIMLLTFGSFLMRIIRKTRQKEITISKAVLDTLYSCFVFVFCYATVFAPFIFASSAYLAGRGILSFFGVFLLLSVMLLSQTDHAWKHWLATAAIGSLLFFCILGITRLGVEQQMVNSMDREYALQLSEQIKTYERKTGTSVTKIAMVTDKYPIYVYSSVLRYCAPYNTLMKSARSESWSQTRFINVFSGMQLKRVAMPDDIYVSHFENKDWNYFIPAEQMFFEGDTVYIAVF